MAEVTLNHTSVNSGSNVILENVSVSFSWKNLNKVDPIPGKYDIVENNYEGFENPRIVLRGHLDVEENRTDAITQELLVDFATLRSETPITLTVPTGSTPIYLKGRPSGGYETDGAQTMQNSLSVVIDSFDISIDSSSEQGRFWSYSITLHETA